MSVYDQSDTAERLEELAGHFGHDDRARVLFVHLADEEAQHQMRVKMPRARYSRPASGLPAVRLDTGAATRSIGEAQQLYDRLGEWAPASVAEAVQLAVDMEEECAGVHAEALTRDCDPDVHELSEMFASQDRLHAQLLTGARG